MNSPTENKGCQLVKSASWYSMLSRKKWLSAILYLGIKTAHGACVYTEHMTGHMDYSMYIHTYLVNPDAIQHQ